MNRRDLITYGISVPFIPSLMSAQTPAATPVANAANRKVIAGSESTTGGAVPVDQLFGEWVGAGNKALYLPIAVSDDDERTLTKADRVWQAIEPTGVTDLDTWLYADIEAEGFEPDFSEYGGVYIGDGDPQMLLEGLHGNGLFEPLKEACDSGTVLYGTSSGCMVLGVNLMLSISPHRPDQSGMTPEETDGLNVIQAEDGTELVLAPHYRNTRTNMWDQMVEATGYKAALIRDGSALTLQNGELSEFGPDPIVWIG